jgi:hypothetical protein
MMPEGIISRETRISLLSGRDNKSDFLTDLERAFEVIIGDLFCHADSSNHINPMPDGSQVSRQARRSSGLDEVESIRSLARRSPRANGEHRAALIQNIEELQGSDASWSVIENAWDISIQ